MLDLKYAEMYALQGVPTTTLARCKESIFQKWCAFRLPNPLKEGYSAKNWDIPEDPGKTKPVKCMKPPPDPPKIKDPRGGGYPTHGSYIFQTPPRQKIYLGVLGNQFLEDDKCIFFPNLSPLKYIFRGGWFTKSWSSMSWMMTGDARRTLETY